MNWTVEYTGGFGAWWKELVEGRQDDVASGAGLLEELGPGPPFPHSSGIEGSRHGHMRQLRVRSGGRPLRVFHAFNPRRTAILLIGGDKIGGDKTGDDRFYEKSVPAADNMHAKRMQPPFLGKTLAFAFDGFIHERHPGKIAETSDHAGMNARDDAGIRDFRFHDPRHTTASYLAMNGANPLEIAEVLGHKTFQMVKRYSHLSDSHVKELVQSVNEKMF